MSLKRRLLVMVVVALVAAVVPASAAVAAVPPESSEAPGGVASAPSSGDGTAGSPAETSTAPLPAPAPTASPAESVTAPAAGEDGPPPGSDEDEVFTASTHDYAAPDGTRVLEVFTEPRFFQDEQGVWAPIDTTLTPASDPGELQPRRADRRAARLQRRLERATLRVPVAGGEVRLRHVGATAADGQAAGSTVRYPDVMGRGRDLLVTMTTTGFEDSVVLPDPAAGNSWRAEFTFPRRLSVREVASGLEFVDRDGEVVATYGDGVAFDGSGSEQAPAASAPVAVRLVAERRGVAEVEVSVAQSWLDAPERQFPVTVDPVYRDVELFSYGPAHTCGASGQETPYAYCDTFASQGQRNTSYTNDHFLNVGSSQADHNNYMFLQFPTEGRQGSGLPVISAYVRLYAFAGNQSSYRVYGNYSSPGASLRWSQMPLSYKQYSDPPGSTTALWTIPAAAGYVDLPITEAVQDWFNGTTNHGLQVRSVSTASSAFRQFTSMEHSGGAYKPTLRITYRPRPVATPTAPDHGSFQCSPPVLSARYEGADNGRVDFSIWGPQGHVQYSERAANDGQVVSSTSPDVPGGHYSWHTRAWDGSFMGDPEWPPFREYFLNAVPATPTVSSPEPVTYSAADAQVLVRASTTDADLGAGRLDHIHFLVYGPSGYVHSEDVPAINGGTSRTIPPGGPPGQYTVYARAYDTCGAYSDTAPLTYRINARPTATQEGPAQATVSCTTTPDLFARLGDPDQESGRVDFSVWGPSGHVTYGERAAANGQQVAFRMPAMPPGIFSWHVRGYDGRDVSDPEWGPFRDVYVNSPPAAPTVTAPANDSSRPFSQGQPTISAGASDADNNLAVVRVVVDGPQGYRHIAEVPAAAGQTVTSRPASASSPGTYAAQVSARDRCGATSGTTTVRYTLSGPGQPQGVRATAIDGGADVAWQPPASAPNGVKEYRVRAHTDGGSVAAEVTVDDTVLGARLALTNGQSYNIDVTAIDRDGAGPASPRVRVSPVPASRVMLAAPDRPTRTSLDITYVQGSAPSSSNVTVYPDANRDMAPDGPAAGSERLDAATQLFEVRVPLAVGANDFLVQVTAPDGRVERLPVPRVTRRERATSGPAGPDGDRTEGVAVRFSPTADAHALLAPLVSQGVALPGAYPAFPTPAGAAPDQRLARWWILRAPPGGDGALRDQMAANPAVEVAEQLVAYQVEATPNDPALAEQYHHDAVQDRQAWDVNTGQLPNGRPVKVGVLDDGFDRTHPELAGRTTPPLTGGTTGCSTAFGDPQAHGTAVAGLIAAEGNNALFGAGVAYRATVVPVIVGTDVDRDGNGTPDACGITPEWPSALVRLVDSSHRADLRVINLSFGTYTRSELAADAVRYAIQAGIAVVASAGNNTTNAPHYPSDFHGVISVTATDAQDRPLPTSNTGPSVDVAAPGDALLTTAPRGSQTRLTGTSAAAAVVAGGLALTAGATGTHGSALAQRYLSAADDAAGDPHPSGATQLRSETYGQGHANNHTAAVDPVTRVGGGNRLSTASAVRQQAFGAPGDRVRRLLVVPADGSPTTSGGNADDFGLQGWRSALPASSLLSDNTTAYLLTNGIADEGQTALPQETQDELEALINVEQVLIVGSAAASISDKVKDQIQTFLRGRGSGVEVARIENVADPSPAGSAAEVATLLGGAPTEALIATEVMFADPLALSAVAAAHGVPMLLVSGEPGARQGAADRVPQSTCDWLRGHASVRTLQIAGGEQAITPGVARTLVDNCGAAGAPRTIVRHAGATRLETALLIAEYNFPVPGQPSFANSAFWPDAVTGATLAVDTQGPILLTAQKYTTGAGQMVDDDALEQNVFDYACVALPQATADSPRYILGGSAVMTAVKETAIRDMSGRCPVGPTQEPPAPPSSPCPNGQNCLRPNMTTAQLQTALNNGGEGAVFQLQPGTYRLDAPLRPHARQQLHGPSPAAGRAIISGAAPVTSWVRDDRNGRPLWRADSPGRRFCVHGQYDRPGSGFAEDLYLNRQPVTQQLISNQSDQSRDSGLTLLEVDEFAIAYDRQNLPRSGAENTVDPAELTNNGCSNEQLAGRRDIGDVLWIAMDPAGLTLEVNVAAQAILAGPGVDGVTVSNLEFYGFGNRAQTGAIDVRSAQGWTLTNLDVSLGHGVGVALGPNSTLRDSRVHDNGQLGVAAGPSSERGPLAAGIIVERNEIALNNWAGYLKDWEAGGAKFVGTLGLIVQRNHVHDNDGAGLWTDTDNQTTTYLENLTTDNTRSGIWHEISFDASILRNTAARNGFYTDATPENGASPDGGINRSTRSSDFFSSSAGIFVASSAGTPEEPAGPGGEPSAIAEEPVLVEDNIVRHNRNGVAIVGQNREACCMYAAPTPEEQGRPYEANIVRVESNFIDHSVSPSGPWFPPGQSGLRQNIVASEEGPVVRVPGQPDRPYFTTDRVLFTANRYRSLRPESFAWRGVETGFELWRAPHGQDVVGMFDGLRCDSVMGCR